MKTREEYEQFIKERFNGQAKELLLRNVELYYQENVEIKKNKYIVGDDVFLKKSAFIHGLGGVIKHNYSKSYDGMQGVYTNPT